MPYTLVYTKEGRLVVSQTLAATAKAVTEMRGCFHAKDILFALRSQAGALEKEGHKAEADEVRKITEQTIRDRLVYNGGAYTGRHAPQYWHILEKRKAGWFAWHRLTRDPETGAIIHAYQPYRVI